MKTLSVAVGLVEHEGRLLFIKRVGGDYADLWALPGGKIEPGEHPAQAMRRELLEEVNIVATDLTFQGIISETISEKTELQRHFLLYIFCVSTKFKCTEWNTEEVGDIFWANVMSAWENSDGVVPSDILIVDHFSKPNPTHLVECEIEKIHGEYIIQKWLSRGN